MRTMLGRLDEDSGGWSGVVATLRRLCVVDQGDVAVDVAVGGDVSGAWI